MGLLDRSRPLVVIVAGSLAVAVAFGIHLFTGGSGTAGSPGPSGQPTAGASSGLPGSPPSTAPVPRRTPSPIPGYLLIADRGNNRMLLVDSKKRMLWAYPKPGTRPSFPFRFDDDTFFGPLYSGFQQIISNQEDQQTVEIVSFPERRVLWTYGHVNQPGSKKGYLDTPDDAYLLADGTRTVADIKNCRILFISPAKRIVRQYGTSGVCTHNPPNELASPNGDTPLHDGSMLVTEINGLC